MPTKIPSARDEIRENIGEIIKHLAPAPGDTDSALRNFDSLGLVELVVALEEHFGVAIPDTALDDEIFSSADRLADLLTSLLPH